MPASPSSSPPARLYYSAEKYARQIGPGCKILCYNGCLITEADGKALFAAELSVATMKKVVSFCQERGLYCQFYKDHKILVERVCEGTTIDPDLANTTAIEAGSFEDYDFQPSPKAMIVAPPEKVAAYQRELDAYLSGGAYMAQSQPYLIEIMPKGVNKASSLALLCRRLGIAQRARSWPAATTPTMPKWSPGQGRAWPWPTPSIR